MGAQAGPHLGPVRHVADEGDAARCAGKACEQPSATVGDGGQAVVAGVSVAAGITTFIVRQRNRSIPENVTANAERRRVRAQTNAAIQERNADKLREARVVLAPAAGVGP